MKLLLLVLFLFLLSTGKLEASSPSEENPIAEALQPGLKNGSIRLLSFPTEKRCLEAREVVESVDCQSMAKNRAYHFLTKEEPKALLLVSHGLQGNSSWFHSGIELARNGIEVLAFDRYGSGMSDGGRAEVKDGNSQSFFQELDAATSYLVNGRKDIPLHLHSNCFSNKIVIPYIHSHMQNSLGYRFDSIINTSPSTHMAEEVEAPYKKHGACLRTVLLSGGWDVGEACSEESLLALQGPNKDSQERFKIRSSLQDEFFTSVSSYLDKMKRSKLELRELSLDYFLFTYMLSMNMEEVLKGEVRGGSLSKEGKFTLPLLMFLFSRDKIVRNDDIVREYFIPYPAYNLTQSQDIIDKCRFCNPWVVGIGVEEACAEYDLSACDYTPYVYETCVDNKYSILNENCSDAKAVQEQRKKDAPKKLVEINCEHAVEFCEKEEELQKYREQMIKWILET